MESSIPPPSNEQKPRLSLKRRKPSNTKKDTKKDTHRENKKLGLLLTRVSIPPSAPKLKREIVDKLQHSEARKLTSEPVDKGSSCQNKGVPRVCVENEVVSPPNSSGSAMDANRCEEASGYAKTDLKTSPPSAKDGGCRAKTNLKTSPPSVKDGGCLSKKISGCKVGRSNVEGGAASRTNAPCVTSSPRSGTPESQRTESHTDAAANTAANSAECAAKGTNSCSDGNLEGNYSSCKEIGERGKEDGLGNLCFCPLCQRDLTKFTKDRREQHLNRCCDAESAKRTEVGGAGSGGGGEHTCVMCRKAFTDLQVSRENRELWVWPCASLWTSYLNALAYLISKA